MFKVTVYIAQERAFAPGIVKEWPKVIPHPTDKNGRLVKVEFSERGNKRLIKKLEGFQK